MFFGNPTLALEAQVANKTVLLEALATLGVTSVSVEYSGGGDSGDVSAASVLPDGVMKNVAETTVTMRFVHGEYIDRQWHYASREKQVQLDIAVGDFAMQWVGMHHSGWENNDGGYGTVNIDVATGVFTLEHVEYYTESKQYDYEL